MEHEGADAFRLKNVRNVVVSGQASLVAELRQADLHSTNRPKAAFGLIGKERYGG